MQDAAISPLSAGRVNFESRATTCRHSESQGHTSAMRGLGPVLTRAEICLSLARRAVRSSLHSSTLPLSRTLVGSQHQSNLTSRLELSTGVRETAPDAGGNGMRREVLVSGGDRSPRADALLASPPLASSWREEAAREGTRHRGWEPYPRRRRRSAVRTQWSATLRRRAVRSVSASVRARGRRWVF
jgi:hypothetical protein